MFQEVSFIILAVQATVTINIHYDCNMFIVQATAYFDAAPVTKKKSVFLLNLEEDERNSSQVAKLDEMGAFLTFVGVKTATVANEANHQMSML